MRRRTVLTSLCAVCLAAAQRAQAPPGTFVLHARRRTGGSVVNSTARWEPSRTAIVICDMWDTHTCNLSAQRVAEMAPRMNQIVSTARGLGATIVHAPSDTMAFYEGTPERRRMQQAPAVSAPIPILMRCPREPAEERDFPIDDSAGGCDDPVVKKWTGPYPWKRQHPAIRIDPADGVSDNGQEVYNLFKQRGITNVALMGVHTNICILNRSFGIRQMTRLGFDVVLVRDLTDAMYDPRARPFVTHARGTELVIEHIEANWCPSIESRDLTQASSDGQALKAARPV